MTTKGSTQLKAFQRKRIDRLITHSASPDMARVQLGRLTAAGGTAALARLTDEQLLAFLQLLGGSIYLTEILIREGADWSGSWADAILVDERSLGSCLSCQECRGKTIGSKAGFHTSPAKSCL